MGPTPCSRARANHEALLAAWTLLVVSCTYIYDKVGRVDFQHVHVNPSLAPIFPDRGGPVDAIACFRSAVLPSMSVKRKVTVPEGRSGMSRSSRSAGRGAARLSHDRGSDHLGAAHRRIIGLTQARMNTVAVGG